MSNNAAKYKVLIKQYLRSIPDISAHLGTNRVVWRRLYLDFTVTIR